MRKITIEDFNKIPVGRRVMVYAPDVCYNPVEGWIAETTMYKYVELANGDEIFSYDIKGIWGVDEKGNREEL